MRARAFVLWCACVLGACNSWPGLEGRDGGTTTGGGVTRFEDASGDLGSSCNASVACNSGLTCAPSFPNGLCTKSCQSDTDCSGGACVLDASAGLVCLRSCSGDLTCRTGYACLSPSGTANVCAPGAASFDAGTD